MTNNSWRLDPGISSCAIYKRRFAILPHTCVDGSKVWLKHYYTKCLVWGYADRSSKVFNDDDYIGHTDNVEDITEAEYIIRKLTEGF